MRKCNSPTVVLIILSFMFLLLGCNGSYMLLPENIPTFEVHGEVQDFEGIFCPYSLRVFDSLICIKDECHDKYFHFFSSSSYKKVGQFGVPGKGPGEYSSKPYFVSGSVNGPTDSILVTWDLNYQLGSIEISDVVNLGQTELTLMKFPPIPDPQRIYMLSDDSALITSTSQEGRVAFCSIETGEFHWLCDHNKDLKKWSSEMDFRELGNEQLVVSSLNNVIVGCSRYVGQVNFYDEKMNLTLSYQKENVLHNIDYRGGPRNLTPISFVSLRASTDYIYVLDANTTYDFWKSKNVQECSILVFNWNGECVCKYQVDCCLQSFEIDERNKKIVGIELSGQDLIIVNVNRHQLL